MKSSKYKIDDILIGDLIYFESTKTQSNHYDFWEVTGKSKHEVFVKYFKFGFDETWAVPISDVRQIDITSIVRQQQSKDNNLDLK